MAKVERAILGMPFYLNHREPQGIHGISQPFLPFVRTAFPPIYTRSLTASLELASNVLQIGITGIPPRQQYLAGLGLAVSKYQWRRETRTHSAKWGINGLVAGCRLLADHVQCSWLAQLVWPIPSHLRDGSSPARDCLDDRLDWLSSVPRVLYCLHFH